MRTVTGYVKHRPKSKHNQPNAKIPIFVYVLRAKNSRFDDTLVFSEVITKTKSKSLAHLAGSY